MQRLPNEKEIPKLPKQYLANVVYTVCGDRFHNWVSKKIEERNVRVQNDKDLMINVDPIIAAAFNNSTAVSL